MKNLGICVVVLVLGTFLHAGEPIRHQLLLNDESRHRIHYVDQFTPEKDWTIQLDGISRDIQRIGEDRILIALATEGGFREYDLKTRKRVHEVVDVSRYKNAMTANRLSDGRTVIGCDQEMVRIFVFDADRKEIQKIEFPGLKTIRLMRPTPRNTFLFGANSDKIYEVDLEGNIIRQVHFAGAKHIYQIVELPNGNWLAASGYGGFLAEIDKEGQIVKRWGGLPAPEGLVYIFMSQFQQLDNGHLVVATWTGHGADDSQKGQQLVEFDAENNVVWTWHDAKRAGSIHGVIVLDDPSEQ